MKIVADSNIIFSALISCKPKYLKIFESAEVYVPDFVFIELARYEARINQRTRVRDALKIFTQELFAQVTVIPNIAIASGSFLHAYSLCRDIDVEDVPFVALSIDLAVPLWTNDKKLIEGLRSKSYNDLLDSDEIFDLLS